MMHYAILLFILFGNVFSGTAQTTTNASLASREQVIAFFASWNKHDFRDINTYIAEDSDFVNVAGMNWKGSEDILSYAVQ